MWGRLVPFHLARPQQATQDQVVQEGIRWVLAGSVPRPQRKRKRRWAAKRACPPTAQGWV